jgi:hypothetical protein
MASLREMLSKIQPNEDFGEIAERIETIIDAYGQPDINQHFRRDVINMVGSVLDLAGSLSLKSYRIDEVFNDIAQIQQYMSLMLRHGLSARPRTQGFALLNTSTGKLVPGFYATDVEAQQYLNFLKTLNLQLPLEIVPAECVTSTILQPVETPQVQLPPPIPPIPLKETAHSGGVKPTPAEEASSPPKPGSPGPEKPPFEAPKPVSAPPLQVNPEKKEIN